MNRDAESVKHARIAQLTTRIGEWVLHPDLGLLRAGEREVRLNPKALHVLLVLLGEGDRGVSRDQLLEQVWGNGYPSDAVVSRAIADLRQAFGESAGEQRYIRTLPKFGYQLVAERGLPSDSSILPASAANLPTESSVDTDPADMGRPSPLAFRWRQRRRLWIAAACLTAVTIALVSMWWFYAPRLTTKPEIAERPSSLRWLRPLTSAPGIEQQPRFSPDGRSVVYSSQQSNRGGWDLFRVALDTGAEHPVAVLEGVHEHGPAVHPGGRDVAYVLLRDDQCQVVVQSLILGSPMPLAKCTTRFPTLVDWSPNGIELAYTAAEQTDPLGLRRLYAVNRRDHTVRPLSNAVSATGTDYYPRYSPNGRQLAFLRGEPQPDHRSTLWTVDVESGLERLVRSQPAQLGGVTWLDDQRLLLSVNDGTGFRLHEINLRNGAETLTESVGLLHPEAHLASGMLAAVERRRDRDLLSISDDGRLQTLAASTSDEDWGQLSPDGEWLALVSRRTGNPELWLTEVASGSARRLTHYNGALVRYPSWHPSGESLLFTAQGEQDERLQHLTLRSGEIETVDANRQQTTPGWMPDGQRWVTGCRENGRWHVCLGDARETVLLAADMYRPQAIDDHSLAVVDADGNLLRLSLGDGRTTLLWDGLPDRGRLAWLLRGETLSYVRGGAESGQFELVERQMKARSERIVFAGSMPAAEMNISRDDAAGRWLITQVRSASDDLQLFQLASGDRATAAITPSAAE